MIYQERKADVFNYHDKGYYLVHCISADFALGAGIAKEIDKRFNVREDLIYYFGKNWYKERFQNIDYIFINGLNQRKKVKAECIFLAESRILNLVTKERYWHKPSYDAMYVALRQMLHTCMELDINKICMPRIGCGLDGLSWDTVSEMIQELFKDTDVEIIVCHL